MNNVSRKPLDWHPYKTAGQPLNFSYNDIFIKVLAWTLLTITQSQKIDKYMYLAQIKKKKILFQPPSPFAAEAAF
jgi:hypothetical protein